MKILFINLPYYGHVIPTIGLVNELIERNHQVTYLLPYDWKDKISACKADFAGYENNPKLSEQIKNAVTAAEKLAPQYDLIIYEQFFFLGKHLAEKFNKPAVRIFTAPVTNERLMNEYINAGGALGIFRFEWIGRQWTKEVANGITLKTDCWLKEIVQNPPNLNLVYTLREFQPYAEDFPEENFKFLGASIYDRNEKKAFDIPKNNNPLIYISLGTVVKGAKTFFKKCFKAFENENVTVIMSVGNSFNQNSLGNIPENFYIYPSVPQLEVLKHADIFITHGGMNSISEAFYYGVPMVVIPFMADQPTNARRIEEMGLGKSLIYKKITSKNLKHTVFSVLKNENISRNISDIRKKLQSCPGNQFGVSAIEEYYFNFNKPK